MKKYNEYQGYFLTIIYYYVNLRKNKIEIPIELTKSIFDLKFENISYKDLDTLNIIIDNINSLHRKLLIQYDENITNDDYLLEKYNILKRLTKMKVIL